MKRQYVHRGRLYTTPELAEMLGVTRKTISQWIRLYKLATVKNPHTPRGHLLTDVQVRRFIKFRLLNAEVWRGGPLRGSARFTFRKSLTALRECWQREALKLTATEKRHADHPEEDRGKGRKARDHGRDPDEECDRFVYGP